jgi:hypothetical protein
MKLLILLILPLIGTLATAQDLYVLRDESGATVFSSKPPEAPNQSVERIVSYDSSLLGDWASSCKKDKFNNAKQCTLYRLHGQITVSIINGNYLVRVGSNHFPSSDSALKIDGNPTLYGKEGSINNPRKAIEQLKFGSIAHTRFKEWPYQSNKDDKEPLDNFREAFDQMMLEYKKL